MSILSKINLSDLLSRVEKTTHKQPEYPAYILFVSISDGEQRATVSHFSGGSLAIILEKIKALVENFNQAWVRIDWITHIEQVSIRQWTTQLEKTKRFYFRRGISIDASFDEAYLEQEINANALLYCGGKIPYCKVNSVNWRVYRKYRYGKKDIVDFNELSHVYTFETEAVFFSSDPHIESFPSANHPVEITRQGRYTGYRNIGELNKESLNRLIKLSSTFLGRQVQPDGQFIYGIYPCFGRPLGSYNSLRHMSSTYAMLEAWEVTQSNFVYSMIKRSLAYSKRELIKSYILPYGGKASFVVDANNDIKLGANAVALLAFVKYTELTGDRQYMVLMDELALGIRFFQNPDTGKFSHVLDSNNLSLKEEFRIVYYDGEAAFGLMRLYGLTKDTRWLNIVKKAFEYFIISEHWRNHDHWLSYCVNEITKYDQSEKYFLFGIKNINGYLKFILNRITTFPTLLELCMAFEEMLRRIESMPHLHHILSGFDLSKFYQAMEYRAHYLQAGFFWPEIAMYFKEPKSVVGSFFIRHHSFRVRIDDVEHYLSGYIAYLRYLSLGKRKVSIDTSYGNGNYRHYFSDSLLSKPSKGVWSAGQLEEITGGTWLVKPESDWFINSVVRTEKHIDLVAAPVLFVASNETELERHGRFKSVRKWDTHSRISAIAKEKEVAGVIVSRKPNVIRSNLPLLLVNDPIKSFIEIAAANRKRLSGKVVVVTGSAGKTSTTQMLASCFKSVMKTHVTYDNYNSRIGVMATLSSAPLDAELVVIEAGLGVDSVRFGNIDLIDPDIAVITNIGAAHIKLGQTTLDVAKKKSTLLDGLRPGALFIICRDTEHFEFLVEKAINKNINVITYGEHSESFIRLTGFDDVTGKASICIDNKKSYSYITPGIGRHMAINSLVCLSIAWSLGVDLDKLISGFSHFTALPGRGDVFEASFQGKQLTVYDESFNANPLSVQSSLDYFAKIPQNNGRKFIILGDMLELGDFAEKQHMSIADNIKNTNADLIYLIGDLMPVNLDYLHSLGMNCRGFNSIDQAIDAFLDDVCDQDLLLIKSSHSVGSYKIVNMLKR